MLGFVHFLNGSSAFLDKRFLYIFVCERLAEISCGLWSPN
jgi:hypothetical protein